MDTLVKKKLRSPFRYPGGKTWFIPYIYSWLKFLGGSDKELVEPFAGGGIIGLTAVFEDLVERVTFVEIDQDVASVWKVILSENVDWLVQSIVEFELSKDNAVKAIQDAEQSLEKRALATILKNRINRGGILANGASFLKHGENGKGIHSRWYPETLKKRILDIHSKRDRITFIEGDGIEIFKEKGKCRKSLFFLDPPYIEASSRLYTHFSINHKYLFEVASNIKGDFLMTYDNLENVEKMADQYDFEYRKIAMRTTHHKIKYELLIGNDLSWI